MAVVVAAPYLRIIPESNPKHTRSMPATLAGCSERVYCLDSDTRQGDPRSAVEA